MSDARNILVGAAQIFVSRGTNNQRPSTVPGSGDLGWTSTQSAKTYLLQNTTKWRDVGYTNAGLEVSYEPGYNDVMVDQLLDAARLFKSTIKVMLKTELTEGSLENVQLAFGQNEDAVTIASSGSVNTNAVLSYAGSTAVDPAKVSTASAGAASAVFANQTTVTPVTATTPTNITFTNAPTFNITRDASGSVSAVTLVYPGVIASQTGAASATLLGTSQRYGTTSGTSAHDVTVAFTASAGGAATAILAIAGGALGDAPMERSIVAVGNAPYQIGATAADTQAPIEVQLGSTSTSAYKERVYVARRVVQIEASTHGLKRDAATIFPVQFRCLPDDNDNYDGAEYGVIVDRVFG